MTRTEWKAIALGVVIGLLVSWGGRTQAAEAQMVTDGTLIYADRADPEGLDPTMFVGSAAFIQGHLLFDTLLARDNDGKLVPLLATSWQLSPDGRSYTFKLRNDVEFHGGKKLTSDDVRYSLERLGSRQVASPWRDLVKSVERVETPDAYTVVIRLAKANRLFLDNMAHTGASIVNRESVEKYGKDFGRTAVEGTGPFKFVERATNDRIVYERFDRYHWGPAFYQNRGPARLKRVIWRVIPELATRQLIMEKGEIDLITHNTLPEILGRAGELKGRVEITRRPVYETRVVALNANFAHLRDRAVRQAIAHAVNAKGIAETIYAPVGVLALNVLHPTVYSYWKGIEPLAPRYDPARAKQILEEAGWKLNPAGIREKGGVALSGVRLMGLPQYKDAALVVKEALGDLGIGVDIELLERGDCILFGERGNVELEVLNTVGTPDMYMEMLHSSNFPGTNPFGWRDPRTDQLIDAFLADPDEGKALDAAKELQRLVVVDEALAVPLYWTSELTLVNSRTLRDFIPTVWLNSGVGKLLSVWSVRR